MTLSGRAGRPRRVLPDDRVLDVGDETFRFFHDGILGVRLSWRPCHSGLIRPAEPAASIVEQERSSATFIGESRSAGIRRPSTEQVEMEMMDRLAGGRSHVADESPAFIQVFHASDVCG